MHSVNRYLGMALQRDKNLRDLKINLRSFYYRPGKVTGGVKPMNRSI